MKSKKLLHSRRAVLEATVLGLAGAGVVQGADQWDPKKKRVDGPIRSGHLLFLGGIGGWYPERRPEGPGAIRQQTRGGAGTMEGSLEEGGSSVGDALEGPGAPGVPGEKL